MLRPVVTAESPGGSAGNHRRITWGGSACGRQPLAGIGLDRTRGTEAKVGLRTMGWPISGRVQGLFILAHLRPRSGGDNGHVRKVRPPLPPGVLEALAELGAGLRDLRRRRRIPVAAAADRALISRSTLYKVERAIRASASAFTRRSCRATACWSGSRAWRRHGSTSGASPSRPQDSLVESGTSRVPGRT